MTTTGSFYTAAKVQAAKDLEAEGWRVTVDPDPRSLPPALQGTSPDIAAQKDGEHMIVRVASSDPRSVGKADARELAVRVAAVPGWSLRVIWLGPPDSPAPIEELKTRARLATRLADEAPDAALLLAWSSVEGLIAHSLRDEGHPQRAGSAVLSEANSLGLLSDEEFDVLREAQRARMRIAHGGSTESSDQSSLRKLVAWLNAHDDDAPVKV